MMDGKKGKNKNKTQNKMNKRESYSELISSNVWFYHLEDLLHFRHSPYDLVIPGLVLFTVRVSGPGLDPRRTGHSGLLQDATWMISGGGAVVVVAVVSGSEGGVHG